MRLRLDAIKRSMRLIAAGFLFVASFVAAHWLSRLDGAPPQETIPPAAAACAMEEEPPTSADVVVWHTGRFDPDRAFIHQAGDLGVSPATVQGLVAALKPFFDFRKARPKHEWRFGFVDGGLQQFSLCVSPQEVFDVDFSQDTPQVQRRDIAVQTRNEVFRGEIRTCLFDAVAEFRAGDRLAVALADVFAWDIDFYLDPRQGDRFEVLVETRYVESDDGMQFVDYGPILAARYLARRKTYDAFLFEDEDGDPAYFNSKGQSLIRDVLRSPLRLTRVTSRFKHRRFHPVLKSTRPHNGVDYGAPRNTPVMAVADGKVVRAGRYGSAGIAVEIAHKGGMLTQYFHLNKISAGIRRGVRVKQGRVIGYVGKTGMATGYHLHFGMKINGVFVDPLKQKYEPGNPIPQDKMNLFAQHVDALTLQLDGVDQPTEVSAVQAIDDQAIHGR